MKSKVTIVFFFISWLGLELFWLLWPFMGHHISASGQSAVFFLISVPFILIILWMRRLQIKTLWFIYGVYMILAIGSYMGLGRLGSTELKIIYLNQTITPLILNLVLLGFFFLLFSVGLVLRRTFDVLGVRKGARDREELESYFEMKMACLPEAGLTPFRYKRLVNIGVSFVASQYNQIKAVIQMLPFEKVFFFYDLTHNQLNDAERKTVISLLLESLKSRPEIRLNMPDALVYVARKVDQVWHTELLEVGFELLAKDSIEAKEYAPQLQGLLKIEFEDWQPFTDINTWYVLRPHTV